MDWIIEHWDEVATVIGSAYIAIRGIVLLTPTSKDDEILGNVEGFIKKAVVILGKIAGLDIKQGLKK